MPSEAVVVASAERRGGSPALGSEEPRGGPAGRAPVLAAGCSGCRGPAPSVVLLQES